MAKNIIQHGESARVSNAIVRIVSILALPLVSLFAHGLVPLVARKSREVPYAVPARLETTGLARRFRVNIDTRHSRTWVPLVTTCYIQNLDTSDSPTSQCHPGVRAKYR